MSSTPTYLAPGYVAAVGDYLDADNNGHEAIYGISLATGQAFQIVNTNPDTYYVPGSGGYQNTESLNAMVSLGDGRIAFGAADYSSFMSSGQVNSEFWISNGTAAGTSYVDIVPGRTGSSPSDFTVVGRADYVVPREHLSDFNGDGHSDILWVNANGSISTWSDTASGARDAFAENSYFAAVPPGWHPVGSFDMNGDGRSDILWRNDGGAVSVWTGNADASFQQAAFNGFAPTSWHIAASGDVTGDGKGDILWQNSDGAISLWSSTGADFAQNSYFHGAVGAGWTVAGLGDVNADGHADLVWRNADGGFAVWDGTTGGFSENSYYANVAPSWHIAAIADFTGDGRDDILWRNTDGALSVWSANIAGGFDQGANSGSAPTDWHVAQAGDFNGDGLADLLWRNDSGATSVWHSTGTGFDQNTYFDASVPTSWHVQGHDLLVMG